jgi:DNA-binding IscR family transcriptional regulator
VLRALLDGEQKTAGEICEEEVMPLQFVYRILKKMELGGLVKITRGKVGGASLNCDLKTVSLYDLLTILGDKPYVNDCMKEGYRCERRRKTGKVCIAHKHIAEVQEALDKELQKRSLYYMLTAADERV